MRILFHFRTQGTGAEGVHLAGMAKAFERLGHEVVFSSPSGIDPRIRAGANPFAGRRRGILALLARLARGPFFELLELAYNGVAWLGLRRLLDRSPCALIYERHAFFLFATALLASRRRIPLVVEVNELAGDERVRASPLFLPLARWSDRMVFSRATAIVVVSPHLARRIAAMGIAPSKILVLPNAVDADLLARAANPRAVRARHGLADTITVGFVGWFVPWHRLDRLLEEFAALAPAEPRLRLLLTGDGPLRADLLRQAEVLGISGRVIFTGAVPHADIPDVLAATDISVVPHGNAYRSPIKLFEAMAAGCAVLAPDLEPIAAVLQPDRNGLLFDVNMPGDLRRKLQRLAADPDLRGRLGTQARLDVEQRHTWDHNAREVLQRIALLPQSAR